MLKALPVVLRPRRAEYFCRYDESTLEAKAMTNGRAPPMVHVVEHTNQCKRHSLKVVWSENGTGHQHSSGKSFHTYAFDLYTGKQIVGESSPPTGDAAFCSRPATRALLVHAS